MKKGRKPRYKYPFQIRFWQKVSRQEDGCWLWTGAKTRGYGSFRLNGKAKLAHRVMLHLVGRKCPPKMHTDPICRQPACVNPSHLEVVTPRVNALRGMVGVARTLERYAVSHCRHGHEYTLENTYIAPDKSRVCKICKNAAFKRWYYKSRARAPSP